MSDQAAQGLERFDEFLRRLMPARGGEFTAEQLDAAAAITAAAIDGERHTIASPRGWSSRAIAAAAALYATLEIQRRVVVVACADYPAALAIGADVDHLLRFDFGLRCAYPQACAAFTPGRVDRVVCDRFTLGGAPVGGGDLRVVALDSGFDLRQLPAAVELAIVDEWQTVASVASEAYTAARRRRLEQLVERARGVVVFASRL